MKPSDLLKKMVRKKRNEQPNGTIDDSLHLELEKQVSWLDHFQGVYMSITNDNFLSIDISVIKDTPYQT